MMYDDAGWGYWMMGIGALVLVLILAGVGVAMAVALRPHPTVPWPAVPTPAVPTPAGPTPVGPTRHTSEEALHELDLRFARGEIDEQSYERSRTVLERPPR